MNTGKQVNVMIGLLFLTVVVVGGYFLNEGNRQSDAREDVAERNAERGARLFVQNCRSCHGLNGLGPEDAPPGFGAKLNSPAFLILGEDNQFGLEATPSGEADGVRRFLTDTIGCGRTGTFMPPWSERFGGSLSDTQIRNIVTMITNARWDFVEHEGIEADEESRLSPAEIIVSDPSALSVTQSNCGQFSGAAAQEFRSRDPFATGAAPAPAATATPAATAAPAGGEVVEVSFAEFSVTVATPSAGAGGVTFRVANDGAIAHELVIIRSDAAPDGLSQAAGVADESQLDVVGRIDQWPGGGDVREATFNLTAGKYLLICNLPGHYQLGMTAAFTVE